MQTAEATLLHLTKERTMKNTIKHFINGSITADSSATLHDIYNPAQGRVIKQVAFASEQEVNQAVDAARKAFVDWSQVTPLKRSRIIFKFKELLEKNINKLAAILTEEHGKVLADAKGEVLRAIELTEFMCGVPNLLKGDFSENVGSNIDSYTIRQPLGVSVGITPFNFPVMISVWMFVPAIACGNTFVLKPSEKDPSAPLLLAQLMQEAGCPPGVLNIVNGDKAAVDQLITHPDVATVSCVGSTPVSQMVYETAIKHGKRSHTFGGAKNHCVVMPDADIEEAAAAIVGAAYGAAGERCMALSVAIAVGDDTADKLIDTIKANTANLKVAAGVEAGVDMGPLVSRSHLERVKSLVDIGVEEGAELIIDGRYFEPDENGHGFFMGPCLFDQVNADMKIYQEEIFGPVLCIVRVEDFKSALQLINENEYGNGTAIFTSHGGVAREFSTRVKVGMVGINVPIPVPVAYHVFGGWKRSSFGDVQMHGEESLRFYTQSKTITSRWPKDKDLDSAFYMPAH